MAEQRRDRTELRDDLPEDVRHPNETGPGGPSLAVGLAAAAIMLVLIALAITII